MGIPRPKTKAVEAPGELKRPPRGEASRNAEKKRLGPAKRENRPTHREKAKGSQPHSGPYATGRFQASCMLDSGTAIKERNSGCFRPNQTQPIVTGRSSTVRAVLFKSRVMRDDLLTVTDREIVLIGLLYV